MVSRLPAHPARGDAVLPTPRRQYTRITYPHEVSLRLHTKITEPDPHRTDHSDLVAPAASPGGH
jgi:hypothetical protein